MEYYLETDTLLTILLILSIVVFGASTWVFIMLGQDKRPSGNSVDTDFIQSDLNVNKARLKGDL